jgi:hypothetical protein
MPVVDQERWNQGLSLDQWTGPSQEEYHQKFIRRVEGLVELEPEREAFFREFPGTARLLVISEECGADSECMGVTRRIQDVMGDKLEVRVFPKVDNMDLMQRYLKEGKYESVPVFIALTEDFEEAAVMYELPPNHNDWVQASRADFMKKGGYPDGTSLGDLPDGEQLAWIDDYRKHFSANFRTITGEMVDELQRLTTASGQLEPVAVRKGGSQTA